MLPSPHKSTMGPFVGALIVIAVLAFGALYFWGAHLNSQAESQNLPYIPADAQ
jgi:hypothetical protein